MGDKVKIVADYISIHKGLIELQKKLEENLNEAFSGFNNLDRITTRIKSKESYLEKSLKKNENGELIYRKPLKEMQDLVGARIVVFYKNDVERVLECIDSYFPPIRQTTIIPDDVTKFGYEGTHNICLIQNYMIPDELYNNPLRPEFFELQIKTLYQHAWSQANHGLGYKPNQALSPEQERKLAFISAQSWGADTILTELINSQNNSGLS